MQHHCWHSRVLPNLWQQYCHQLLHYNPTIPVFEAHSRIKMISTPMSNSIHHQSRINAHPWDRVHICNLSQYGWLHEWSSCLPGKWRLWYLSSWQRGGLHTLHTGEVIELFEFTRYIGACPWASQRVPTVTAQITFLLANLLDFDYGQNCTQHVGLQSSECPWQML